MNTLAKAIHDIVVEGKLLAAVSVSLSEKERRALVETLAILEQNSAHSPAPTQTEDEWW